MVLQSILLGVPPKHIDRFKEWSDILVMSPKSISKEDVEEIMKIKRKAEKELEGRGPDGPFIIQ
ncbi:hypothetical protein B5G50_17605 [Brevibacillus brevis]|uniref:hypothetical protein n=1 Tax=Brevibacillus brevis TaxID=1393 RepID=UPI000B3663A1|nr:hypothetical protein [Brevibacillus brevis]OUQ87039.1 hypothetical protein B5G50_17605 [Brevibacillus brevis]